MGIIIPTIRGNSGLRKAPNPFDLGVCYLSDSKKSAAVGHAPGQHFFCGVFLIQTIYRLNRQNET